ncbi:MAG: hypothetical protein ACRDXB_00660 [Actinomycetes bacterium]
MTLLGVWSGILLVTVLFLRELTRSRHAVVRSPGSGPSVEGDVADPRWTPGFGSVVALAIIASVLLVPRLWELLT